MSKKLIRISVKNLVNFSLNKGHIEKGKTVMLLESARDGTACHMAFQKQMTKEYGQENFEKEVYVTDEVSNDEVILKVSGRIDGLLSDGEKVSIYEVKTTWKEINKIGRNDYPAHWGQAVCYGYMYLKKENRDSIIIKLVYINRDTREKKEFREVYTFGEVEKQFNCFIKEYITWMMHVRKWETLRNKSIKSLPFPFSDYRRGQRSFAVKSYISIRDKTRLFAQAPTGIGKTIGAMFPAVKAIGEGLIDRIFYLTAKTVTAGIAADTYKKMCKAGLNLRVVVITAKDKVCPLEKRNCDPEKCERANNYYERSNNAVKDLLNNQFLDRNTIKEYADLYNICPFELSLDASIYSDLIICDYNYLFDPRIKLQRFFDEVKENYCFLVDEAHNLVDRGREMYSSEIEKDKVLELRRETDPKWDDMKKRLTKLNNELNSIKKKIFQETKNDVHESGREIPGDLVTAAKQCTAIMEKYLDYEMKEEYNEKFLDFYFNLLYFSKVSEMYDEKYSVFYMIERKSFRVKLMCLDPSRLLSKAMDKGTSTILFSATLEPASYFKSILGGREQDRSISLASPFPGENLMVAVEGRISTKYKDRDMSYAEIAVLLRESVKSKTGNYIVFFPSYKYMNDVLKIYEDICGEVEIMVQKPGMAEIDREIFLERFETYGSNTLVAFAVMGGIFGEGIDLEGEKLSGVIIIGTGLPTVCAEREMIRSYYNENNGRGFDYAYTYPGLNRVLQAAGRVIRSESDRGFIILIDSRFAGRKYKALYPIWWKPEYFTGGDRSMADSISTFHLL